MVGSFRNELSVACIGSDGISMVTHARPVLDGIAHDDKGRIKVVGYVNAEELKERLDCADSAWVHKIIDELTG
jgi:hypothetical protein